MQPLQRILLVTLQLVDQPTQQVAFAAQAITIMLQLQQGLAELVRILHRLPNPTDVPTARTRAAPRWGRRIQQDV